MRKLTLFLGLIVIFVVLFIFVCPRISYSYATSCNREHKCSEMIEEKCGSDELVDPVVSECVYKLIDTQEYKDCLENFTNCVSENEKKFSFMKLLNKVCVLRSKIRFK